jgi:ferredoxin
MLRIIHFRGKCIGCNACVEANNFRWRISQRDGKATLIGGKEKKGIFSSLISNDELEVNRAAEKNCPVACIRVESLVPR